jgi:hypothetical protein
MQTGWSYLDVKTTQDEKAYWKEVVTKSSPYSAAIEAGALCGGADELTANQMRSMGDLYGGNGADPYDLTTPWRYRLV